MFTNQGIIQSWSSYAPEAIDDFGEDGDFARQHLLNQHLLRLVGDVRDKTVLDAGSGTGYLSRKLANLGAQVTAIEPSQNFYQYATKHEATKPLGITYLQEDLSQYQPKTQFDLIVSNMVLMDIPDWTQAIDACIKALKPEGSFVFSILHPCFDEEGGTEFLEYGHVRVRNYLNENNRPMTYGHNFHRPLSFYLNYCLQHGLALTEMVEPKLDQAIADQFTKHQRDLVVPSFIICHFQTRA